MPDKKWGWFTVLFVLALAVCAWWIAVTKDPALVRCQFVVVELVADRPLRRRRSHGAFTHRRHSYQRPQPDQPVALPVGGVARSHPRCLFRRIDLEHEPEPRLPDHPDPVACAARNQQRLSRRQQRHRREQEDDTAAGCRSGSSPGRRRARQSRLPGCRPPPVRWLSPPRRRRRPPATGWSERWLPTTRRWPRAGAICSWETKKRPTAPWTSADCRSL